jgi:hypothetical protein
MFTACIGYVSYDILPQIPLHSVIADTGDNEHPVLIIMGVYCES